MQGFRVPPDRGLLSVSGPERADFLNDLLTSQIQPAISYAALLTPQGRYLHDFFCITGPNEIYLDTEFSRLPELQQRLLRYKLRRKVELQDVSAGQKLVISSAPLTGVFPGGPDPRSVELGNRLIVPASTVTDITHELSGSGLPALSALEYSFELLQRAIPDGSHDMSPGHSLPLEFNLDLLGGISFSKGCYIGQEVMTRMAHRDKIRRRLFAVTLNAPAPIATTPIYAENEIVGELGRSLNGMALALLRPGSESLPLTCMGQQLFPVPGNHGKN